MANLVRLFFALWYLGGGPVHVALGLARGRTYAAFGDTMLLPGGRAVWANVVMPHITAFALLLAAFELTTGLLILGNGRAVKLLGFAASILFNLYLAQQGLGMPQHDGLADFLTNRLVNLAFAAAQLPLLRMCYDETFWASLQSGRQASAHQV